MIGTRGVPASYGGFETCVEEVGKRLVRHGHDVTVYCRKSYYADRPSTYEGIKLIYLPNLRMKSLDTMSHTLLSVIHALRSSFDVLMIFNAANSLAMLVPRLWGNKIAINPDGLEWKRGKWGAVAKNYYKFSEWLSTKVADRIVADSPGIQEYYLHKYHMESTYIAYGAYLVKSTKPELIKSLGVSPGEYFLQITRFEPENNPLLTVNAFNKMNSGKKLVLVGGVPYRSSYSEMIKKEAGANVILPGAIYDKDMLRELWCNCFAYVHGNEVGGTNPALLQAMASGCFILSIDVDFNQFVLQNSGIYFDKSVESIAEKMEWTILHAQELREYKERAKKRIEDYYSWDAIAMQYEHLFREMSLRA